MAIADQMSEDTLDEQFAKAFAEDDEEGIEDTLDEQFARAFADDDDDEEEEEETEEERKLKRRDSLFNESEEGESDQEMLHRELFGEEEDGDSLFGESKDEARDQTMHNGQLFDKGDDDRHDQLLNEKEQPVAPRPAPKAPTGGLALPSLPKARAGGLALPVLPKAPTSLPTPPPTPSNAPALLPEQSPAKRKRTDVEQEKPEKKRKQDPSKSNSQPATTTTPSWVPQYVGQLSAKRKRADQDAQEQAAAAKKPKTIPAIQYRCRYACDRLATSGCHKPIKSKVALKAHMEKVHNLWYGKLVDENSPTDTKKPRQQCNNCKKIFGPGMDFDKHYRAHLTCGLKDHEAWKVPPPQGIQEYADTWGMTDLHGEMSSYLIITSDDQNDDEPFVELPAAEKENTKEVPEHALSGIASQARLAVHAQFVEYRASMAPVVHMAPPVATAPIVRMPPTVTAAPEPSMAHMAFALPAPVPTLTSTNPDRSFDQLMRDLDLIESHPELLNDIPDELLEWVRNFAVSDSWNGQPSSNQAGRSSGNPIVLD